MWENETKGDFVINRRLVGDTASVSSVSLSVVLKHPFQPLHHPLGYSVPLHGAEITLVLERLPKWKSFLTHPELILMCGEGLLWFTMNRFHENNNSQNGFCVLFISLIPVSRPMLDGCLGAGPEVLQPAEEDHDPWGEGWHEHCRHWWGTLH